jgi:hypothetical protein
MKAVYVIGVLMVCVVIVMADNEKRNDFPGNSDKNLNAEIKRMLNEDEPQQKEIAKRGGKISVAISGYINIFVSTSLIKELFLSVSLAIEPVSNEKIAAKMYVN